MQPPDPAPEPVARRAPVPHGLFALLIAITCVGPLSLNILMPALPGIAVALKTDSESVQLLLSLYLVAMAGGQLALGALSDRFGRRPVLLAGFAVTVAASFAAMAATSIAALIAARTVQAIGASTGIVISRAIIRDLYDRDRAASMISWVTMVIMVVPMVTPWLGGVLQTTLGWQAVFAGIGLSAATVLAWVALALPETLAVQAGGGGLTRFLAELRALATTRRFIGYVVCCATGSALFFAFLGGAPHVLITQMGRSPVELGVWFASGAFGYMIGNFMSARSSTRFGLDTMVAWGVCIAVGGSVLAVAMVVLVPGWGPITIFLPQFVVAFGNGLLLPNSIAGAISVRPQAAGTASGITGFLQMAVGAAGAQLVGHILDGTQTALPMVLVLLGFALACALAYLALIRRS